MTQAQRLSRQDGNIVTSLFFLYCGSVKNTVYLINWLSCTNGLSMVHLMAMGRHSLQEGMKHMQRSGCFCAVVDF